MKLEVPNIHARRPEGNDLPEGIFGIEPNDHAVYLVVSNTSPTNAGTHTNKRNAMQWLALPVKLKRQKGTGTARFGDIKNPCSAVDTGCSPRPRNLQHQAEQESSPPVP